LKELVSERAKKTEAKKSSDSKSKDSKSSSTKEKTAKPLTAGQKAEKARKAREEYKSEKKKEPSSMTAEELDKKIADVRQRMRELKAQLKDALDRARTSQTAANRR
jgi:hypothetical protein